MSLDVFVHKGKKLQRTFMFYMKIRTGRNDSFRHLCLPEAFQITCARVWVISLSLLSQAIRRSSLPTITWPPGHEWIYSFTEQEMVTGEKKFARNIKRKESLSSLLDVTRHYLMLTLKKKDGLIKSEFGLRSFWDVDVIKKRTKCNIPRYQESREVRYLHSYFATCPP